MHIEHINISAPIELLIKIKEFYCNVFDVEEGFRPKFSSKGYWLYSDGKAVIHLTNSIEHHRNEKQGYFDHVAFQVKGLKLMVDRLNSLGISYTIDYLPEVGMTQLFFKDPSGTGVEANFVGETLFPL